MLRQEGRVLARSRDLFLNPLVERSGFIIRLLIRFPVETLTEFAVGALRGGNIPDSGKGGVEEALRDRVQGIKAYGATGK